ncbi:uncharacterized protein PV09_07689 [Verruconis gallopava]|uniref:Zn(2)-C6 fungal-type domain-containing protein n=1 Tax=Verruconis gallopava TaxID=253628 RepID=A0A0D2A1T0_9PEZI|nr:uncharacterized protein PV09_07689 [Verruconis gallopava]KIW00703.1 hypothetical protein PV09_07689 [Verruconis gallopava]
MDAASVLANSHPDSLNVFQSPPPQLPPYGFPDQLQVTQEDVGTGTPPNVPKSKRRKLSAFNEGVKGLDDAEGEADNALQRNGSARKSRPAGTKRACNQCRQQKLKCNVIENPWKSCDRCVKHKLDCVITADFKRVGKRSQQAELERSNDELQRQVVELTRALAARDQNGGLYEQHLRRQLEEANMANFTATPPTADDGSHDAALLLNLKQSDPNRATPLGRITPMGRTQALESVILTPDMIDSLWAEYYTRYHEYLPVLEPDVDNPDHVLQRSRFLFWTIVMVASRHFALDSTLFSRLERPYEKLVRDTITRPPTRDQHHAVKALCLLCTWPLPVSSTTEDMTFVYSGIMMKFAMHLGIHRPSSPTDFNNIPINLQQDQVKDRLRTWAICNLVAQNVATSFGQPPETVWDSTLLPRVGETPAALQALQNRLKIEQKVDKVTRTVYCGDASPKTIKALNDELQELALTMDLNNDLDNLYYRALMLHFNLKAFFANHDSEDYAIALQALHTSTRYFLDAAFKLDLLYAPNYIMQMCIAAVVSLLKLLNSFFGFQEYSERESGVEMFWEAINRIRTMSVRPNDLPQRLAEVFAQMWNAWDTLNSERVGGPIAESVTNGEIDSSLTLKRRYRMSMSHVFDSVWRWKEEMHGERDKLKDALKNPTSPIAMTHRSSSMSNGRRPSSSMMDDVDHVTTMASFGAYGSLPLSAPQDMTFSTGYDFFDPLGWALNNEMAGMPIPDAFVPQHSGNMGW